METFPAMKYAIQCIWLAALVTPCEGLAGAGAIDFETLTEEMERGEIVHLVDIRTAALFQEGHIPGAMNLPLAGIERRRMPALGRVVVYGDGLGRYSGDEGARLLEQKSGISADYLEGGYAAWQSSGGATTEAAGVKELRSPYLTYEQVSQSGGRGLTLVDLSGSDSAGPVFGLRSTGESAPRVDLADHFPAARITASVEQALGGVASSGKPSIATRAGSPSGSPGSAGPVVLIDDGSGRADELARKLRGSGYHNVVVLAGGMDIIRLRGREGSSRLSGGEIPVESGESAEPERNQR